MKAQPEAKIEPRNPQQRIAEWSTRLKARMAGVFEALEGAGSAGGQVLIRGSLVVTGNAAATAASILGHEPLFRLGSVK